MTMSSLATESIQSPNRYWGRAYNVTRVTIHHMAGCLSAWQCGQIFLNPSRQASSNYGIGNDGEIACYVDEEDAAWTSSSYDNDNRAITIEVSDSPEGVATGSWAISDAAWDSMIALCADICDRYGIEPTYTGDTSGSFTEHMMFAPTGCPGPYIHDRMDEIVRQVKDRMEGNDMTIDELFNTMIATGDDGNIPLWQAWSWAYTYAKRADAKCAELEERIKQIEAGNVDYKELAKAVNDDVAKRMQA